MFFAVSLAFIGFKPMITNLFLATISYSIYLTLREWMIVFYLFLLLSCGIVGGIAWASDQESTSTAGLQSSQVLALITDLGITVLNFVMISRWYWRFRKSGGIKGVGQTENLLEERIAGGVASAGKKAGSYAGKKFEQVAEKEKQREADEEAKLKAIEQA